MAFQQELLKTVAVVTLAATHVVGAPLLPAATTVALIAIQAFSLLHVLLVPSGKTLDKDEASALRSATKWLSSTWPATATLARIASGLVLAIALARSLRSLDLAGSPLLVVSLACIFGGLCQAGMMVFRQRTGSAAEISWPALHLDEVEEQESSPLSSLVEEYYGPKSMLSASSFIGTEVSAEQAASPSSPQQAQVAPAEATQSAGTPRPSMAVLASCLILAITFARVLRSLNLSNSLLQVVSLACLGGAFCQAGMRVARRQAGGAAECCSRSPISWPTLQLDEEVEEQAKSSPLSNLVEEYYSPSSMLSSSSFLDMED